MQTIRRVFSQTVWQGLGKVVSLASAVVALGLITRNYGAAGIGVNTLAFTYLAFFYLAADLALNSHILSKLRSNPREANLLFNFRLYWSASLVLLAVLLLPLLPFSSPAFNSTVILGVVTIVAFGITNSANLIFQYNHAYKYSSLASILNAAVFLPLLLLLVYVKVSIPFLALAWALGWIVNSVISLILVRRFYSFKILPFNLGYIRAVLKEAWPISATVIINTIYFRADAFILSSYRGFTEVGIYNLSYQIFQNVIVIPTFIMNGYYPIMLRAFQDNKKLFWRQFKTAVFIMLGLGIAGSIFTWFLSPLAVNILTGGDGFDGSVRVLRILSFSFPAFFISSLLIWTMIVFKKYKLMFWIYLFGFLFNLITNLWVIPRYSYVGASFVTGISEYLILILQIIILFPALRKELKHKDLLHASV